MNEQRTDRKETLRQAKIYFASGQLEKSIEYFSLAEKQGQDLPHIWLSRGAAYIAMGEFNAAKKDLTQLLQLDPKNERACYFRGIARIALGEYEKAIDDLTQSLIQNNDRGIAHLLRGVAYAELGQDTDAQLDINSASAFSRAEFTSFDKVFGKLPDAFKNSTALRSRDNAPWNNLLSQESGDMLLGKAD